MPARTAVAEAPPIAPFTIVLYPFIQGEKGSRRPAEFDRTISAGAVDAMLAACSSQAWLG